MEFSKEKASIDRLRKERARRAIISNKEVSSSSVLEKVEEEEQDSSEPEIPKSDQ